MKLLNNNAKHFEMISNSGNYKITAKMKVDYDSVNDFWGTREWVYQVVDLRTNKNVNLTKKGEKVLKPFYLRKKNFIKDLDSIVMFSIAISEMKINSAR
jgi:hypothetical protein